MKHNLCGIEGELRITPDVREFVATRTEGDLKVEVEVRYDDRLGNGHNTFTIVGSYWKRNPSGRFPRNPSGVGQIIEEIVQMFPELTPYMKWHLVSSDGPLHYIVDTVYLAGDRDYAGRRKGEVSRVERYLQMNRSPFRHRPSCGDQERFLKFLEASYNLPEWATGPVEVPCCLGVASSHWTLEEYPCEWHQAPFQTEQEARTWIEALNHYDWCIGSEPVAWAEGKERELDKARRAAMWPDATDEELCQPPEALRAALEARLPALMAEFRADLERMGLST